MKTEKKHSLLVMQLPDSYNPGNGVPTSFPSSTVILHPRAIQPITDIHEALEVSTWIKGNVYRSYGNPIVSNSESIVKYNNYVYVCRSNNLKNLKNQQNISNYPPESSSGVLLDGYQWVPLFRIDPSNKGNYIKTPSYDSIINTIKDYEESFCTPETNGKTGDCSLYLKDNFIGKLIGSMTTDCNVCNKIAKTLADNTIVAKFKTNSAVDDIDSQISLITNKEKLTSILNEPISRTDFGLSTYKNNLNAGFSAGCVFSVNIDPNYLYTGVSTNLTINVIGSGTDAIVEFEYSAKVGNTGNISGIKITNGGVGYGPNTSVNITGMSGVSGNDLAKAISVIVPSDTTNISDISSIFNTKSSFPDKTITLISAAVNPKEIGLSPNAYALLTNQSDDTLPSNITNVKFFNSTTINTSTSIDEKLKFNFIRII